MTSKNPVENRAVIKFLAELGNTPTQTYEMMQRTSIKSSVSRALVFRWHRRFRDGQIGLEDESGRGRKTIIVVKMIESIKDVIYTDRRVTIREICDLTGHSYGTVQKVLEKHLNMQKVSARWIPRLLSKDNKDTRVNASRKFLQRFRKEGNNFIERIVTTDETWLFLYDPDTKEQSKQWKTPGSPPPKKARVSKSAGKQMFISFADINGMSLQHAVPTNETVNADYYSKVLRRDLVKALLRKRPGIDLDRVILHQDNAPPHTAETTQLEIVLGFETVEHPPFSPDLAPMDFRVFPVLKSALRGNRFDSFTELSYAAQNIVSKLDSQWYKDMYSQWIDRHGKCISCGGEYFEKE